MLNEIMKIECVVREDGQTVARVTGKNGDPIDLLPGEALSVTVNAEGVGGGPSK